MRNIRKYLRSSKLFSEIFYSLHIDDLMVRFKFGEFENSINAAIKRFAPEVMFGSEKELRKLKKQIRHSYYVCKSSPDEYFLMGLSDFNDKGKCTFVTDKFLFMTMAKIASRKKHDEEIEDKYGFYNLAKPYFKRQVVMVNSPNDYESFQSMALEVRDLILKPLDACMGKGIEAVTITDEVHAKEIFERIVNNGKWVVEERIKQVKQMADWNESCVNTVRFLSFLNPKTGFNAITPFFRTGRRGAIVDNAGSGGIFANVDVKTGTLCTDGIDEMGKRYEEHPDSHLKFRGWQIPQYDDLVGMVKEMHQTIMPSHPYIGWDLALTDKGWVVIEANWGQFINQYADHIGRKQEFMEYVTGNKYSIS